MHHLGKIIHQMHTLLKITIGDYGQAQEHLILTGLLVIRPLILPLTLVELKYGVL